MLSVAGADHIITMDLHASQIQVRLFTECSVFLDQISERESAGVSGSLVQ